jgi:hypothetical protein
LISHLSDQADE